MSLRSTGAVIFTAILSALPAAADPSGAVLAAPGDCAQPIGEFVTQTVYGQSAGVAGPASDHFAPRSTTDSVQRLLPLDLTRTTTPAVGLVRDTIETTGETVSGVIGGTGAPEIIEGMTGGGRIEIGLPGGGNEILSDSLGGGGAGGGGGGLPVETLTNGLTQTVDGLVGRQ